MEKYFSTDRKIALPPTRSEETRVTASFPARTLVRDRQIYFCFVSAAVGEKILCTPQKKVIFHIQGVEEKKINANFSYEISFLYDD